MKLQITSAFLALALLATGCAKKEAGAAATGADSTMAKAGATTMSPVERGKYLVTIASCNDCHTPLKMGPKGPEPDMSRMLSGHPEGMKLPPPPKAEGPWIVAGAATLTAWHGPWGTTYTANLTPDSATGIGKWDETTFMLAIRNGKFIGTGRAIMPPMPWEYIKQMTDDDLKAVFAYLRSIPAIKNKVPDYEPPAGGPMAMEGNAPAGKEMKKK
jgi:mono/diheme cytochrome c family protein